MTLLYGPYTRRLRPPRYCRMDLTRWGPITAFTRSLFVDWNRSHATVVRSTPEPLWLRRVTVVKPLWSGCYRLGYLAKQTILNLSSDQIDHDDLLVQAKAGALFELTNRVSRRRFVVVQGSHARGLVPADEEDGGYTRVFSVDDIPWEIHQIEDPEVRATARAQFLRSALST